MLHWGSQGITRNLREAAEYYRMGAEGADGNDPVATYDYGVVLLRVGTTFLFSYVNGPFSGFSNPVFDYRCVHTDDTETDTDTAKLAQKPMGICVAVCLYAV